MAVTTGETPAIATSEPLLIEFVLTDALRMPASVGLVPNVTVSDVAEADVTVPVAPSSSVTTLCAATGSKPNPLMITVLALAAIKPVEFAVIAGITVATCTALPLLIVSVLTVDDNVPAMVGSVVKVTVNKVGVADETVPAAPLSNVTTLSVAVVSNPKPAMVTVVALAARLAVLLVTTGITLATCSAVPLPTPLVVTMAVSGPAEAGLLTKVTVRLVAVAVVTLPVAPSLNVTTLLANVVLKPEPAIVTVAESAVRSAVDTVTTGFTVATCTAAPLFKLPMATMAVSVPAAVGFVPNVTTKLVLFELVTVPAAPLLSVTRLLPGVPLNPNPLIVTVVASAAMATVLAVTTGVTLAT